MANVGDEIQVQHRCQVTFAIDKDYKDTVWYDVPSMVNGDILLGRLWMYDKNRTHGMHDNTYTFAQNGKHVTLHPMKPEPPKNGSRSITKISFKYTLSTEATSRSTKLEVELFPTCGE